MVYSLQKAIHQAVHNEKKNKNKKKCCFSSVFTVSFLHLLSSEYINGNLLISPIKKIGKMQPATTTTATTKGKKRKEGKCSFNSKGSKQLDLGIL